MAMFNSRNEDLSRKTEAVRCVVCGKKLRNGTPLIPKTMVERTRGWCGACWVADKQSQEILAG